MRTVRNEYRGLSDTTSALKAKDHTFKAHFHRRSLVYAGLVRVKSFVMKRPRSSEMGNAPLRRIKSAAAGDSQSKFQNSYSVAEGTFLVPRKQMNCNSSKIFSPRVSKWSVSKRGEKWRELRFKTQEYILRPDAALVYLEPFRDVAEEFVRKLYVIRDSNEEVPNFLIELYKWNLESKGAGQHSFRVLTDRACLQPVPPDQLNGGPGEMMDPVFHWTK
ncbi:hypothetical protein AVEN_144264-1 [Araneus ventricosus]|uniref:Uncharacterized protein n=1 Tax=Araneus ventricosus TaxID=182803 RepID=A0A4Y2V0T4_ARAVE|nr:hypothetical protein AVEN_144264-1 [Araneus ventricosus]